ncbi:PREDICTED: deleted in malignant brain tumors 1 protein-like [Crocodylus porosus]|uniref:deleted in malignant brain tumors 1 protein-like n=1 Tax=Crocodylus porosus TaxID=8502 RepID=UPI0009404200|nr:PREDICTED: deleted in malignant brain tumors 1 protein-like [Crocodylus porosus]
MREKGFQFHITCIMNQNTVSEIKYVAKDAIYIQETQYGKFDVNISFFESSYFLKQVNTSPYYVNLNQDLFLQATLYSSDPNLVIFIDTCVASPYPDNFRNLTYDLIKSGCPIDPTYNTYYSPSSNIVRFKFNAFKFLNRHSEVYLQCKMVVCTENDPSSRCYQGCLARYKRDTSSYQKKMDVIVGPVQLQRKTEDTKLGNLFL